MNTIEAEFHAESSAAVVGTGRSQSERILNCLVEHAGSWVAMPVLAKAATPTGIGTAVHSRISDLRHAGHAIEHHQEWVGRVNHSFYRIPIAPNVYEQDVREAEAAYQQNPSDRNARDVLDAKAATKRHAAPLPSPVS